MIQSTHPMSEYMLNICTGINNQFAREFLDNTGLKLKDILNLLLIWKQCTSQDLSVGHALCCAQTVVVYVYEVDDECAFCLNDEFAALWLMRKIQV